MADHIPLREGLNSAGGYVVPDAYAQLLLEGVRNESAALSLAGNVQTTTAKTTNFPIFAGTPEAQFVGEGQKKPKGGAEFKTFQVNVKKLAIIIPMTDEFIADAQVDPMLLVDDKVRQGFAAVIDRHILGYAKTGPIATSFDNSLLQTSQEALMGDEKDALRLSVSDAMAQIEANGYTPSGIVLPSDARRYLRDARKAVESTDVLYQGTEWAYGMRSGFSSNLHHMEDANEGPIAVVGDWNNLIVRMRQDITVSTSNQATIEIDGNAVNLWEHNMTAVRYEMRVACGAWDLNRAFAKITKPAAE